MSQDTFTDLESFNVVVAGNGAIGMALMQKLLELDNLGQVVMLGRSAKPLPDDPRVSFLPIDAERPDSVLAAADNVSQSVKRVHLLINTVGFLHTEHQQPEKNLRAVTAENLQRAFIVNSTLLPLLAQAFGRLIRHDEPAVLASLSARVGSIEDNQLGGWYSYRASKAAHNMLLKSISREWRISHRNVTVAALHPGTVQSRLSEPFVTERYPNRVLTPDECARSLLDVIYGLRVKDTGCFLDWQGKSIPW